MGSTCHPKEWLLSTLQNLTPGNDRKKGNGVLGIFSSYFCFSFLRIMGLLVTPVSVHLSSKNKQQTRPY